MTGRQAGNPELILADSCNEINGFRKALGSLWKHWGALTWDPKHILADSWKETNGFKKRRMAPGASKM